jgi:hypothetical protein
MLSVGNLAVTKKPAPAINVLLMNVPVPVVVWLLELTSPPVNQPAVLPAKLLCVPSSKLIGFPTNPVLVVLLATAMPLAEIVLILMFARPFLPPILLVLPIPLLVLNLLP